MFTGMNISASALTTNRLKMDVIAANLANANTTRAEFVDGKWQPYRRKLVEVSPLNPSPFDRMLQANLNQNQAGSIGGVRATRIIDDQTPFKRAYQPEHPDADEEGYVYLPNVDPLKEMVDLMAVTRSYEANISAFNATKTMMLKTLEIGK